MQDWVKKILSPFRKEKKEEEASTSGSFSSWESMNPDEIPEGKKRSKSGFQKTFFNVGILLGVFVGIMVIQMTVQKFLNVGKKSTAEQVPSEATTEIASTPASPESTTETVAAPSEVPAVDEPAETVIAQPYTPKFNEQGEEELPIFTEKITEAVKPLYAVDPNEETLPILQESTPAPAVEGETKVAEAETYTPKLNEQGEEELPILTEKTVEKSNIATTEQPETTVVVLGENQPAASPAPSEAPAAAPAIVASAPVTTETPAPVAAASSPAPTAIAPSPAPAPVAVAPTSQPAAKKAPASAPAADATHTPEWYAKQNAATRALLAEKAKAVKSGKKTIVVKSKEEASKVAKSAGSAAVITEVQVQAETPGFVEEESQSIASIGRQ